jgi:hypothetical protein
VLDTLEKKGGITRAYLSQKRLPDAWSSFR